MADDSNESHEVITTRGNGAPNYALKKRLPPRLPRKKNEIYATKKTPFKAQLARCEKLLQEGESEIIIHGLGAAVVVAVNLALQLRDVFHQTLDLDVRTDTVDIIDDLEPQDDETEPATSTRQNSAVHIRVFRIALEKLYV
ncbi:ribonuclease P protein subunit p20 [Ischnura elegans]|uniref:ribonuclease P protein subunit p20 n=1 Tax=Ischnura elegans TaxID=197161 RepID=UPI001ED88B47|nr:ribonuclease P protein subunit p20 [Ischnura elegans]